MATPTWLNTSPDDGTGVLKHMEVAILLLYFYSSNAFCW